MSRSRSSVCRSCCLPSTSCCCTCICFSTCNSCASIRALRSASVSVYPTTGIRNDTNNSTDTALRIDNIEFQYTIHTNTAKQPGYPGCFMCLVLFLFCLSFSFHLYSRHVYWCRFFLFLFYFLHKCDHFISTVVYGHSVWNREILYLDLLLKIIK